MRHIARHPLLVVCLSIAFATGVFAQQDFSKVEIKTTKLAGNLYTLEGQGGAIGVLTGPDGVLMVDSQFAPLTEKIVAAIKAIDPGPIRYLINTHVHGDHTGGNAISVRWGSPSSRVRSCGLGSRSLVPQPPAHPERRRPRLRCRASPTMRR